MSEDEKDTANEAKGLKVVFRSLRYRNFRLFFTGQSISLIGTWIQQIAMPWLVYDISHSVFLLGVVSFTGQIPILLLGSFSGVLSDRWNRYYILIVTQSLAMIQALTLTIVIFYGNIQVWHIILLSTLLGCINAFDVPARQSFLVQMVEDKKDLGNAIALNSTMFNGARLIGPSIAGILIATMGEGICFLINGLSYLVVIASLLLMNRLPRNANLRSNGFGKAIKEGFSYTFNFIPIKYIILLIALFSLAGLPYSVLMPVYARDILQGGSHTFGFLMGAAGLGAMTGAIYLASRKYVPGLEKLIPRSIILFGLGLIALSISHNFYLSVALMVISGFGMMLGLASCNTILQTIIDDDKRGRVMSIYTMAFMGGAPFGSLIAGSLGTIAGVPFTLSLGGITCVLGALIFAAKLPQMHSMIYPIYVKLGIIRSTE
jgi:MFS family permease